MCECYQKSKQVSVVITLKCDRKRYAHMCFYLVGKSTWLEKVPGPKIYIEFVTTIYGDLGECFVISFSS